MRWFKALGGLLLITLLAGCIKVEGNIVVNDDGGGSVDLLTALDSEGVLSILGDFDIPEAELGGADELCEDFSSDTSGGSDFPADAQFTPYEEDGFCGERITFNLSPSTDHSAAIAGVFDGDDARLFKQGENWIFETNLDLDDLDSDTEGLPPGMADALFGDASIKFTVDLPGKAIDGQNNATNVGSDGRFEWDIDFANPPARLFAQTEPGSGGGSGGGGGLGLILIVVAALLLAAAAAWWFLTQRKSGDSVTPPPMGAGAPMGAAAPVMGAPGTAAPVAAAPPTAGAPIDPVRPSNPQAQETVAMSVAEAQAAATEMSASASPEPVFDESLNAWVIDDPIQGRLVHDAASNTWKPNPAN